MENVEISTAPLSHHDFTVGDMRCSKHAPEYLCVSLDHRLPEGLTEYLRSTCDAGLTVGAPLNDCRSRDRCILEDLTCEITELVSSCQPAAGVGLLPDKIDTWPAVPQLACWATFL